VQNFSPAEEFFHVLKCYRSSVNGFPSLGSVSTYRGYASFSDICGACFGCGSGFGIGFTLLLTRSFTRSSPSRHPPFTQYPFPSRSLVRDGHTTIDPERSPEYRLWLEATRKEYELLDKTMGCWEVVDIDRLTQDTNLIGVKWVFKIKYKNGEYERHKARIVDHGINNARTSTSSRHFRQQFLMSRSDWYLPSLHFLTGME
jgi:hypothetical protein